MVETNYIDRITGLPVKNPLFVVQYNSNMGLVDKSDMQMSFTDSTRKTLKWYKKMFFHMIHVCAKCCLLYTSRCV